MDKYQFKISIFISFHYFLKKHLYFCALIIFLNLKCNFFLETLLLFEFLTSHRNEEQHLEDHSLKVFEFLKCYFFAFLSPVKENVKK